MKLPECDSRRPVEDAEDEFLCLHPQVVSRGNRVTDGICKSCVYCQSPPPGELVEPEEDSTLRRIGPCRHLGEQTGGRRCGSCGGSVRIKIFACRHPDHTETTLRDCLLCEDYQREP